MLILGLLYDSAVARRKVVLNDDDPDFLRAKTKYYFIIFSLKKSEVYRQVLSATASSILNNTYALSLLGNVAPYDSRLKFQRTLRLYAFCPQDLRNTNLYMSTSTRGFRCPASFGAR